MQILIIFLIVLSVLVLIHELGHFLAARIFGVKAEEFGYGFPPRLAGIVRDHGKWKIVKHDDQRSYKNTIWSLNWLPLGGFVRIKGEGTEDVMDDPDSFHVKPIWQRIVILAAGVSMNWLLAFALFSAIFLIGVPTILEGVPKEAVIQNRTVSITDVLSGSPAEKAGLQPGDKVLSVAGTAPENFDQARTDISYQGDKSFAIDYERNGKKTEVTLQPTFIKEINKSGIGVGLADVGIVHFSPLQAFWYAGSAVGSYTKEIIFSFGTLLKDLVSLKKVSEDVSGPIGIAVITGQIAKQGIIPLLQFMAILSINLAVINFLPIPALDGGRVLFLIIEKIRHKAMARKLEATIHQIAFISLIIIILLVTIRDIGHYGGVILGGIKGLVGM